MIAKINNGSNLYGALIYNYEKVKEGKGAILATNRIIQNLSPEQDLHVHLAIRSFEPYLIANQRTSKPIVHISINPDPKHKLTDEEYISLAEEYLNKMNFTDQPYIIYKHQDTDRTHLHIVTTRLGETGKKKVSDSHEWIRNKEACWELEQKYSLIPMVEESATTNTISKLKKVDYQKADIKNQIHNTLLTLLENYKFQTFGEYNALLSCFNIHAKQVRGEDSANPYKGIVYSVINSKGEIVGLPIKSSQMSKRLGYEAIEKRIKHYNDYFKKAKIPSKKSILVNAIKSSQNPADFRKQLNKSNMDVIFRINETKRIYGVTFIDHANRLVYNGSRLGKEFSANNFNTFYNERNNIPTSDQLDKGTTLSPNFDVIDESAFVDVDEIFGTFNLKYHGEDLEYEFRKKNKKKKRQIRR